MKAIFYSTARLSKNQVAVCNSNLLVAFIFLILILILSPDFAHAGTGGEELQSLYDKFLAVAKGYGGKLAALAAFIFAAINAVKGNVWSFISAFTVGIITGVGPEMLTNGVAALI